MMKAKNLASNNNQSQFQLNLKTLTKMEQAVNHMKTSKKV